MIIALAFDQYLHTELIFNKVFGCLQDPGNTHNMNDANGVRGQNKLKVGIEVLFSETHLSSQG